MNCDYEQEGFCCLEDYTGIKKKCPSEKDFRCTAKPSDLIEICEDCYKPVSECECGTNWILATTPDGKIVPFTPKQFNKLKAKEEALEK